MRNLAIVLVVGMMMSLPSAMGQNLSAAQDSDSSLNAKIMQSLTQSYKNLLSSLDALRDEGKNDEKQEKNKKDIAPLPPPKSKASLGVYIQEAGEGVRIINLTDPSPAANAGVKVEDVVVMANGNKVNSIGDLQDVMEKVSPGDVVKLTIKRGDEKINCNVKTPKTSAVYSAHAEDEENKVQKLKELKADSRKFKELKKFLKSQKTESSDEGESGFTIKPDDGKKIVERKGDTQGKAILGVMIDGTDGKVRVVDMPDNSPAEKAGVKVNDIIIKANGKDINAADDLTGVMANVKPGKVVNLVVVRGDKKFKAKVNTGDSNQVFGNAMKVTELEDEPHALAKKFKIHKHVEARAEENESRDEGRAGMIHELLKKYLSDSGECGDCSECGIYDDDDACDEGCYVIKLDDGNKCMVWKSDDDDCDEDCYAFDYSFDDDDCDMDFDRDDAKCIVKKLKLPGRDGNVKVYICTDDDEEVCCPGENHRKIMRFHHGKKREHACPSCGRCGHEDNEITIKIEISGCGSTHHDVWKSKRDGHRKIFDRKRHDFGCDQHGKRIKKKAKRIKVYKNGSDARCDGKRSCDEEVLIFDCDEKP